MSNRLTIVFLSICLIIILTVLSNAQAERGITNEISSDHLGPVRTDLAVMGVPETSPLTSAVKHPTDGNYQLDDWVLTYSDTLSLFIPQSDYLAVRLDPLSADVSYISSYSGISEIQQQAIDRAPVWLAADLEDNFRRFLYSFVADDIAQVILDAPDPYVDEVAFECAHIAPDALGAMYYDLLLENVADVYAVDDSLHFVDIVDHGNSNDDDYYTSVIYTVIEENGDTIEYELEKEYYYWYIVHPRLSDETPTYINPDNGQIAPPPWGYFWRDYLWNYADEGYPLYSAIWSEVEIYWDRSNSGPDAIDVMNQWIDDVMDFGAGAERPIQPVRIYALHCGNCGEYSDLRAAIGRTALIPTVCTMNICEDHTWDEIYERDWIHWDGGGNSFNNPLLYENGWGKTLSAVYNYRGDGYVWDVTDRYSEGVCTLNVSVTDSTGRPLDGQRISIDTDALWGGLYTCIWDVTDVNGQVSITLGDEKNYYIRVDGFRAYPAFGTISIINNSVAGQTYNWDCVIPSALPQHNLSEASDYPNPLNHFRLEVDYNVEYSAAYQLFIPGSEFSLKQQMSCIDLFVADEENYTSYIGNAPAEAFGITDNTDSGIIDFQLPTNDPWYAVFSAREFDVNCQRINLTVNVYLNVTGVKDAGDTALPLTFQLDTPYPNPFNRAAVIGFSLPTEEKISLAVYDLTGKRVVTLANQTYPAGQHEVRWTETTSLAAGVYFVELSGSAHTSIQKVCYLK